MGGKTKVMLQTAKPSNIGGLTILYFKVPNHLNQKEHLIQRPYGAFFLILLKWSATFSNKKKIKNIKAVKKPYSVRKIHKNSLSCEFLLLL